MTPAQWLRLGLWREPVFSAVKDSRARLRAARQSPLIDDVPALLLRHLGFQSRPIFSTKRQRRAFFADSRFPIPESRIPAAELP
ncbi:hypothetical protein VDF76_10270 [Xanthomonas campestris pv. raphani]|uniref:hypothetical protein n=1 Tax=Xanthomonas campestris TaxID=339 RepID=UPI002B22683D|nr:hypothetical protein [Xanthomonas campestris]MEA9747405.1 hypothetical protein [Xanthomonas campestris pv. raphani]MEA9847956.1 hypothetical protein [Xanthomonas campestris pv. raphani]MEA9929302.1 hypothetical protein [Xanthomonas campestris pv. raphani]